MSFARSLALLIFCSSLAGAALCALAAVLSPSQYHSVYAALVVSDIVSDRLLQERLSPPGGNLAGKPISESTQWVLLDEFGSIARIPLDEYQRRVSSFDPRNDGYAEKLRSFFVHDGKRYMFIPVSRKKTTFEKHISTVLADIPYTLEYLGFQKPLKLYFILFPVSGVGFFVLWYIRKKSIKETAGLLPCLLVLTPFAFYGASGFVQAALFLGLSALLQEPLSKYFALLRLPVSDDICAEKRRRCFHSLYAPFKQYWQPFLFFPAAFALTIIFSEIPPLLSPAVFTFCTGASVFSTLVFSTPGNPKRHTRFSPVPIIKQRSPALSVSMLPFALAALFVVFLAPFFTVTPAALPDTPRLVSEAAYLEHTAFQYSFSLRPLGSKAPGYPLYALDADGLLRTAVESGSTDIWKKGQDIPPFPLKGLMGFLESADTGKAAALPLHSTFEALFRELIPILFLFVFAIPEFLLKSRNSATVPGKSRRKKKPQWKWGDKKPQKILLCPVDRKYHLAQKDA